jgi:hypothetical protein
VLDIRLWCLLFVVTACAPSDEQGLIVVDDESALFVLRDDEVEGYRDSRLWHRVERRDSGAMLISEVSGAIAPFPSIAVWSVEDFIPGRYSVEMFVPGYDSSRLGHVLVCVTARPALRSSSCVVVDQRVPGWHLLGVWELTSVDVSLDPAVRWSEFSQVVLVDAVRLAPRW